MKHDHAGFASAAAAYAGESVEARVRRFVPMVRKAAWHLAGSAPAGIEAEDLEQAGLLALTECAQRHGSRGEDGFAAYAKTRARGAMIDLMRRADPASRTDRRRLKRIEEERARFVAAHGRPPDDAELAEAVGCDASEIAGLSARDVRLETLDPHSAEQDDRFREPEPDALDRLVAMEDSARLAEAVAALGERHQLVLQLYFVEELNLAEIAETLQISTPRVHQLKEAALAKLRSILAG